MLPDLYANLLPMVPELYLLLSTIVLLLFGVYCQQRISLNMTVSVLVVLALTIYLVPYGGSARATSFNAMFLSDGFTDFAKILILGGAMLVLMVISGWLHSEGGRPFEFLLLFLFSLVGMMLMVSANSLLAVYMALELMSLPLYVLASFNRDSTRSTEAGLKYFVLGALASGILLFGISLIYGFTGTLQFAGLADYFRGFGEEAAGGYVLSRAVIVGLVLVLIGFCFKVSAVPFHMWTPDVYQGSPTAVTAFFAVSPKVAAFALFARMLLEPFADISGEWSQIVIFVSIASMLVGALAALRQTNIKRLLAYSSIGHAGFILMGIATGTASGVQGVLIYLAIYIFMTAGAFGCVLLMRRGGEYVEEVADLAGLSRNQPGLALALAIFMFSMAGIPPLAGFFAKFYVIMPAIEAGLVWLAIIGLLTSVISCYYYLRVVKFMYFDEPTAEGFEGSTPWMVKGGLAICSLVTVFYFLVPAPLVTQAREAASIILY